MRKENALDMRDADPEFEYVLLGAAGIALKANRL
jgi:hypothetical protein